MFATFCDADGFQMPKHYVVFRKKLRLDVNLAFHTKAGVVVHKDDEPPKVDSMVFRTGLLMCLVSCRYHDMMRFVLHNAQCFATGSRWCWFLQVATSETRFPSCPDTSRRSRSARPQVKSNKTPTQLQLLRTLCRTKREKTAKRRWVLCGTKPWFPLLRQLWSETRLKRYSREWQAFVKYVPNCLVSR